MKVIGWTHCGDERYPDMEDPIDKKVYGADYDIFVKLIIKDIRKHGYHFSGFYHQCGDYGVPVFSNGKSLCVSFRTWGRIMADAWPDELDNSSPMGYCNWAWYAPNGMNEIVPEGDACL